MYCLKRNMLCFLKLYCHIRTMWRCFDCFKDTTGCNLLQCFLLFQGLFCCFKDKTGCCFECFKDTTGWILLQCFYCFKDFFVVSRTKLDVVLNVSRTQLDEFYAMFLLFQGLFCCFKDKIECCFECFKDTTGWILLQCF